MQIIPLQPVASQTVNVQLGGQSVQINLYAKTALFDPVYEPGVGTVLFCDVLVSDSPIITGVPCWQANRILRDAYLGFSGDLVIYDTLGSSDPVYSGLGARWLMVWLSPADLASIGLAA